jgi:hypothetical protein
LSIYFRQDLTFPGVTFDHRSEPFTNFARNQDQAEPLLTSGYDGMPNVSTSLVVS